MNRPTTRRPPPAVRDMGVGKYSYDDRVGTPGASLPQNVGDGLANDAICISLKRRINIDKDAKRPWVCRLTHF